MNNPVHCTGELHLVTFTKLQKKANTFMDLFWIAVFQVINMKYQKLHKRVITFVHKIKIFNAHTK